VETLGSRRDQKPTVHDEGSPAQVQRLRRCIAGRCGLEFCKDDRRLRPRTESIIIDSDCIESPVVVALIGAFINIH